MSANVFPPNRGKLAKARAFITEQLANGPRLRTEIIDTGKRLGFEVGVLERASEQMSINVESLRVEGVGTRSRWSLPSDPAEVLVPPPPELLPAAPVTEPSSFSQQLEQLQRANRSIDIYRYLDGEPAYLDTVGSTQLTMAHIKRRYGGGRYWIEGLTFTVEGASLSPDGEVQNPKGRRSGSEQAPAGQLSTTDLFLMMFKQQSELLTALITRGSGTDPVAMFKVLNDAIDKRMPATPAPSRPADDALSLIREGMNLASQIEGRPEGEGWATSLKEFAPLVTALVNRINTPAAGPVAIVEAPGTAVSPAPQDATPVTHLEAVLADLTPILPDLCSRAKQGTPVKAVAEYILEKADDDQYEALAGAAESPQFVSDLMTELAKRLPNDGYALPWLRTLADRINELLAEDRARETPTAASGGSSPDGDGV